MKIFQTFYFIFIFCVGNIFNLSAHVAVDNPTGGETFSAGDTIEIQWRIEINHNLLNWDVYFSPDGGSNWQIIELDLSPSQLTYTWIVPNEATTAGRIRVYMDNSGMDYEDETTDFTILGAPKSIHVPLDFATIQQAIDFSVDGDTIEVHPGTYVENINFNSRNIMLTSEFLTSGDTAAIVNTIIDGGGLGSVLFFQGGEDSTAKVIGFTLKNGLASQGGAIYCRNSSPTICHNLIIENKATNGAGIYGENSNMFIYNNTFSENIADSIGGAVYFTQNSILVLMNNILWNDSAIIDGNEIIFDNTSNSTATYNNISGGFQGQNNLNCNPTFCDIDSMKYYLDESSCNVGNGKDGANIGAFGIGCKLSTGLVQAYNQEIFLNAFPNPFSTTTNIQFTLERPTYATLKIYDLMGKMIVNLLQENLNAGTYNASWSSITLPVGTYFYRLETEEFMITKKIILAP